MPIDDAPGSGALAVFIWDVRKGCRSLEGDLVERAAPTVRGRQPVAGHEPRRPAKVLSVAGRSESQVEGVAFYVPERQILPVTVWCQPVHRVDLQVR